jgi:hypothetical protein
VPIPRGPDLDTISRALLGRLDARLTTQRSATGETLGERFAAEHPHLLPLPRLAFRAAAMQVVPVSRRALVPLVGAYYSVPCEWAGLEIPAYVGPTTVALAGPTQTVLHPRGRLGTKVVFYPHYLPELARKPQAVRQVAGPLVHDLGAPCPAVWQQLVDEHGAADAARHFARLLREILELGLGAVRRRLTAALAREAPLAPALRPVGSPVVTVPPERLPPSVHGIEVVAARAADYDVLLASGAA